MNPLIMNADELVRWYKPQTEMEKHLLDQITEQQQDLQADVVGLYSTITSQEEKLSGFDELKSRLNQLRLKLAAGDIEDPADELQMILEDYS